MPSQLMDFRLLEAAAPVIKVLGHPMRLRLVELLEERERSVSDLTAALGAEQAIVSQQLMKLRGLGIVAARRSGPNVFYRVDNPRVLKILDCLRHCSAEDFE